MKFPSDCTNEEDRYDYLRRCKRVLDKQVLRTDEATWRKVTPILNKQYRAFVETVKSRAVAISDELLNGVLDGIVYPPEVDSPKKRLFWLETLDEALRLHHNRQGRRFRDGKISESAFRSYQANWHGIRHLIVYREKRRLRRMLDQNPRWPVTEAVVKKLGVAEAAVN